MKRLYGIGINNFKYLTYYFNFTIKGYYYIRSQNSKVLSTNSLETTISWDVEMHCHLLN